MHKIRREGVFINSQEIHLYAVNIANSYMQFTGKSESWKQQLSVDDYNTFRCQALKELAGGVELAGKEVDNITQPTPSPVPNYTKPMKPIAQSELTPPVSAPVPKATIIKMPEPVNMTEAEAEAEAIAILNALPD